MFTGILLGSFFGHSFGHGNSPQCHEEITGQQLPHCVPSTRFDCFPWPICVSRLKDAEVILSAFLFSLNCWICVVTKIPWILNITT